MILLIATRELRSLLVMPSTWFVFAVLQFIFAWFFLNALEAFLDFQPQMTQIANAPGVTLVIAAPLFNMAALLLMMLVPMFTMRLIAEERRNQTFPLLLSSPLSNLSIVLGKFFGLLIFLLMLMSTLPLMMYTLASGTQLDHGLIMSNYLGLLLLTASYVSLGLYISTLTTQPVIAAIGAMVVLVGLWLVGLGASTPDSPWHQVSPLHHFQNFNNGLLDSSDIVFFFVFSATFLLLAIRRIDNNRRYG
ncbi:MAG: ABC transporter permease subunit [Gallionella sp.]